MREKTAEVIAQKKFENQGGNRLFTNKDLKKKADHPPHY